MDGLPKPMPMQMMLSCFLQTEPEEHECGSPLFSFIMLHDESHPPMLLESYPPFSYTPRLLHAT